MRASWRDEHGAGIHPRTGPHVRSEINNQGTLPRYVRRIVFCGQKAQSPNKKSKYAVRISRIFPGKIRTSPWDISHNAASKSYPSLNVGLNPSPAKSWEISSTFWGQIHGDFPQKSRGKFNSVCPVRQIRVGQIAGVLPGVLRQCSVECKPEPRSYPRSLPSSIVPSGSSSPHPSDPKEPRSVQFTRTRGVHPP
jgi:hypothetical protein